jgi:phospholipid/cholesterol/gamma-HCH transport system ATP-binding protein
MRQPETIVSVSGLKTAFGPHVVHEDLDLDVRRGEILGVIGGSGTGKSVLLRAMIGLIRPVAGRIEVFGDDIVDMDRRTRARLERQRGVMFQEIGRASCRERV